MISLVAISNYLGAVYISPKRLKVTYSAPEIMIAGCLLGVILTNART